MSDANQTSKELYQLYRRGFNGLTNTYCQVKRNHPLGDFPKITAAIWRAGMLLEIWQRIATQNAIQKYKGE